MLEKLTELLDEAEELHGTMRKATSLEKADFLMLNGVVLPPVRVGQHVKDRCGDEYIVVGFSHKASRSGTKTTIDVMDVAYEGNTIFCVNPCTIEEFRRRYVEV